jgi:signal transduction histidine kinase
LTALLATWYVARSLRQIVLLTRHAEELTNRISGVGEHPETPKLPVRNPYDEVGRLATNFNVLFERVDSVVQQLRLFVSNAAHELRTPLAVMRGETQFLLAQPRPVAEYERTLRVIDAELATMGRIIEGLFTLSMADAGQLNIQRDPLHLDEVLEEACGIAAPLAREKRIAIQKRKWQEEEFRGDQTMLRQLFLILMENAVKYSPSNTAITVDLRTRAGRPTAIIEDQGPGIAPEDLPHIFERFYRAAPQTSDESRSGGLGLAIAAAIVKAHDGSIICESEVGQGSRFIVSFTPPGS